MLGFGPYGILWLGLGLFSRIWVKIDPKGDIALRMGQEGTNRQMDRRTDCPCVLQDFVLFGATALLRLINSGF